MPYKYHWLDLMTIIHSPIRLQEHQIFNMIGLKSLSLAVLVLAGEALAAMQIQYRIKWKNAQGQHEVRTAAGGSVPDIQVQRIQSNMFRWSGGHYTASEEGGKLVVENVKECPYYGHTSIVLNGMQAAIRYNVPALGGVREYS